MRKDVWNTYRTTGYTHQVGTDPRATGGVHHHQVKRTSRGWLHRVVETNGRYRSVGPVSELSEQDGESKYEMAVKN